MPWQRAHSPESLIIIDLVSPCFYFLYHWLVPLLHGRSMVFWVCPFEGVLTSLVRLILAKSSDYDQQCSISLNLMNCNEQLKISSSITA